MERDRWLTILAVLGTTALVGCEKKDSPVTEVPAAAASEGSEQSCGEGGCGSKDAEEEAEAPEATADAAAPEGAATGDAPAPTAETAAPTETAAAAETAAAPKPKAKPKKKKAKAKSSGEQACGEGTCA